MIVALTTKVGKDQITDPLLSPATSYHHIFGTKLEKEYDGTK